MNLRQTLAYARGALQSKKVEDAALEGEILLRYATDLNRARLFASYEIPLDSKQENIFNEVLERRLNGEPTAYIIGRREFFGLEFYVDRRVLIPRPESELLVEKAVELAGKREIKTIADIGTGSGAIAVSLALNIPEVIVYAVDISAAALDVAELNCKNNRVSDRVKMLQGDLTESLPEPVDMIIANLPYVKTSDLQSHVTKNFEPLQALDGGKDGLDVIRTFCKQVGKKINPRGCLLMEIGRGQAKQVTGLLHQAFPGNVIETCLDLSGTERIVSLCLT